MTRYRLISPNERLYLAIEPLFPPLCVQLVVEAEGALTLPELEAALAQAGNANPGCRLRQRGFWWSDSGLSPPLRVLTRSPHVPLFAEPALKVRLAPAAGPTAEVAYFPGASPVLVFRALHAVMDARGLLHWANDVLRALRGEPLLGTNTKWTDRDFLNAEKSTQRLPPFVTDANSLLTRATRSKSAAGLPWGRFPPGHSVNNGRLETCPTGMKDAYVWSRRTLPAGIGTAFVARLIAALVRGLQPGLWRFGIPVDLRIATPDALSPANRTNPLFVEVAPDAAWPAVQAQIVRQLAERREFARLTGESLLAWAPQWFIRAACHWSQHRQWRQNRHFLSAVLSHVGKVPLTALSYTGFQATAAYFLPIDAFACSVAFVSVEHDHGVELLASAPSSCGDQLQALLDRVAEQLSLRGCFQGENVARPPALMLHGLFEQQASATPERLALVENERTLTYRQLDRRANAVAARLVAQGVQVGDPVALCLPRSLEAVVAMVGILKAGAAFVPLDPDWPAERRQFVLDDCGARLLDVVDDAEVAEPVPRAADVAYILYTSGSTGRPKGVVVGHRSIVNYVLWAGKAYLDGLDGAVFPLFTALTFDLTLTSIFVPLASGGRIVVHPATDPLLLLHDIVARREANVVKLTPSHLAILRELDLRGTSIKKFIVGGERFATELARAIHDACGAELFNEYGPTEATVGCMIHRFDPAETTASVLIGQPIDNAEVLLLDEAQQPVAAGARGELWLAGDCLARGYLNRPEDTAFQSNPLQREKVAYRTGDLAVWRDGIGLEYLGRADEQVKINGHRVELGEVERVIRGLGHECAVAAHRGAGGSLRLVAYLVAPTPGDSATIRRHWQEKLPPFLLPAAVHWLTELPLTTNGKLDRARLPLPEVPAVTPPCEMQSHDAALLALAQGIAGHPVEWERSLYECGFDSLQVAVLLSRVAARFGGENATALLVRLGSLRGHPSLAAIKKEIATDGHR